MYMDLFVCYDLGMIKCPQSLKKKKKKTVSKNKYF